MQNIAPLMAWVDIKEHRDAIYLIISMYKIQMLKINEDPKIITHF